MLQSLKSPFDSNGSHPRISKSSLRTSSGKLLPSTPHHPKPVKHRVSTPYPKKEESSNSPDSFNAMVPLSSVPFHTRPVDKRTPTSYPSLQAAESRDGHDQVADVHESIIRFSEPVMPNPIEEEAQDTARPKNNTKIKKTYSGLSGISDSNSSLHAHAVHFDRNAGIKSLYHSHQGKSSSWDVPNEADPQFKETKYTHTVKPKEIDSLVSPPQGTFQAVDDIPRARSSTRVPEPRITLSILSKLSRSGSTSPPASLDIFNPFEGSAECFEVSDKVNDTRHSYRSTSSLSLTSTADTCFPSPLRKWEEAFDDNTGPSCNTLAPSLFFSADFANSFESPFFDEIIAREIGSSVGLGLPSSTLVTLGDVRIREDVMGHGIETSNDQNKMPSWDFGDKKEWMGLSAWGKISRWSKGIELQELASFAIGASALGAVYFSLRR